MGRRRHEHAPLHALRDVSSRLPAHGGVKRKDEPPPSRIGPGRQFCRSFEKRVNVQLGAGRRRNCATLFPWSPHLAPHENSLFRKLIDRAGTVQRQAQIFCRKGEENFASALTTAGPALVQPISYLSMTQGSA